MLPPRLALALSATCALGAVPPGCQRPGGEGRRADEPIVRVLAAASTRGPVSELARAATHATDGPATGQPPGTGLHVEMSFGPSGALARQIEAGQPANVFVSADPRWTEWLVGRGLLPAEAPRPVASNRLVLVAAPGEPLRWSPTEGDLAARAPGRWTTADPQTAPLGRYAKAALTRLHAWSALAPSLVPARDAAAAVRLVEDGHVRWGIVYASDARAASGLRVVARLPASLHPPILYVVALLPGASPAARAFADALAGAAGRAAFAAAGFLPPPPDRGSSPAAAPTARSSRVRP